MYTVTVIVIKAIIIPEHYRFYGTRSSDAYYGDCTI